MHYRNVRKLPDDEFWWLRVDEPNSLTKLICNWFTKLLTGCTNMDYHTLRIIVNIWFLWIATLIRHETSTVYACWMWSLKKVEFPVCMTASPHLDWMAHKTSQITWKTSIQRTIVVYWIRCSSEGRCMMCQYNYRLILVGYNIQLSTMDIKWLYIEIGIIIIVDWKKIYYVR